MFSGAQPQPQAPSGRGLISLVEEEDAPARALQAVAGSVDSMEQQVDGAQDYESLINALRGDEQPIQARYAELAKVVGAQDAQATPESVLTVVQPSLELLNGKGIAGLMASMGGGAPAAPQQPQGFAEGGMVGGIDPAIDQQYDAYAKRIQGILGPQRSLDALVRERQNLLAGDDTSNFDANLALMSYGAQVASTPGGLLQSLAKPMPDLASNLSKVANKRADINRAVKLNALETRDSDDKTRKGALVSALKDSFENVNAMRRQELAAKTTMASTGTESMMGPDGKIFGVRRTLNGLEMVGGGAVPAGSVPIDASTMTALGLGKPGEQAKEGVNVIYDDGSKATLTQRGTNWYDTSGQLVTRPFTLDKGASGRSSAQELVLKAPDSKTGLRTVPGFYKDGQYFYTENGITKEVDAADVLPGKMSDYVKTETNADGRGGSRITVLEGPNKGQTFFQEGSGDPVPPVQEVFKQSQENLQRHPPVLQEAFTVGQIDPNGPYSPYVEARPKAYVSGRGNMTKEEVDKSSSTIAAAENLLRTTDEVLKQMPEAVGIWPTVKSFVGNATGSVGLNAFVDPKTEAGRNALKNYVKAVQEAEALNPRFAVTEMKFNEELAGSPEKMFRSPELAMSVVREISRRAMNEIEVERARLEGRNPLHIDRVPMGTKSDPFDWGNPKDQQYILNLQKLGLPTTGISVKIGDKIGTL